MCFKIRSQSVYAASNLIFAGGPPAGAGSIISLPFPLIYLSFQAIFFNSLTIIKTFHYEKSNQHEGFL